MFGTLGTLAQKHPARPVPLPTAERAADPEKQVAISRLPSALIDELDEPGEPGEPDRNSTATISLPPAESLTETEMEAQSQYTMAQMAEIEWAAVEKFIMAVLPARGRTGTREALVRKPCNIINH